MLRDPFAEKAEILSDQEVLDSFQAMPVDHQLLNKLLDKTTRIVIGARGSGKSMLMKRALLEARASEDKPLCIYVNFQKYLRLEPYVYKSSEALNLFRDWVIAKIFVAVVEEARANVGGLEPVLRATELTEPDADELKAFVERLEGSMAGSRAVQSKWLPNLSVEQIVRGIDSLRSHLHRPRGVLLMDDAAHAFSPEFQEEFFNVFRLFRTANLSAKAAVYPGSTNYGPTFNPGHDALETRVERAVEDKDYETFMLSILKARLPEKDFARLNSDEEMLLAICYAASGNPRSVIVLAREVLESTGSKSNPKRSAYKEAIDSYCNNYMWKQHDSLKRRLPRFETQVTAGETFVHKLVQWLRMLNEKSRNKQTPFFAIEEGAPAEFLKIVGLLEYAGIVQIRGTVRRGLTRPLTRYQLHLAIAISQGVFIGAQGATVPVTLEQLRSLPMRRYKMFTQESKELVEILSSSSVTLPPCRKCGRPRIVAEARFCSYCGAELLESSVYVELLNSPVDFLSIPAKKAEALKEAGLLTVRDLMMDSESAKLRTAHRIGNVWATRIRKSAEEYLEG